MGKVILVNGEVKRNDGGGRGLCKFVKRKRRALRR